jgi:UDP-N-acetylenolpyruvoylglucosamine reductase
MSTPIEPVKAYKTYIFGDQTDQKLHKRHQKLPSALAHIGATLFDAKTIAACSNELFYAEGTANPMILLRVVQNKQVQSEEIA